MRMITMGAMALCAVLAGSASVLAQSTDKAASVPVKPAINLNLATVEQLATLPGIGDRTAERILEYRQKNGGFKKIEELMNVKGIGEKSFLKLKPLVTVAPRADKVGGAD